MIIALAISIVFCIIMMLILNSTVAEHIRMIENLHRRIQDIEIERVDKDKPFSNNLKY